MIRAAPSALKPAAVVLMWSWTKPLNCVSCVCPLCFDRTAITLPDHPRCCCHHHHHHGIFGFHPGNPFLFNLRPLSYGPFLQIRAPHPPLSGPLPIVSPRLQSGCRLPPLGVGVRSWGTHLINPWRMMRRGFGPRTLSRASRKPSPSTHHVAAGKSSSLMKARCTVWPSFFLEWDVWKMWIQVMGWGQGSGMLFLIKHRQNIHTMCYITDICAPIFPINSIYTPTHSCFLHSCQLHLIL